jgi:hypothetical protein
MQRFLLDRGIQVRFEIDDNEIGSSSIGLSKNEGTRTSKRERFSMAIQLVGFPSRAMDFS